MGHIDIRLTTCSLPLFYACDTLYVLKLVRVQTVCEVSIRITFFFGGKIEKSENVCCNIMAITYQGVYILEKYREPRIFGDFFYTSRKKRIILLKFYRDSENLKKNSLFDNFVLIATKIIVIKYDKKLILEICTNKSLKYFLCLEF